MVKQVDESQSTACNGKVKIEYEILDDATAAAGKWEPAGNLKRQPLLIRPLLLDRSLQPGAAVINSSPKPSRFSHGQPANTYPGLTKPGKGKQMSQTFTTPMASATTPESSRLMTQGTSRQLGKITGRKKGRSRALRQRIADIFEATAKRMEYLDTKD